MNDPEYCQGIYEAAKKVVEYHEDHKEFTGIFYLSNIDILLEALKRALEGKE